MIAVILYRSHGLADKLLNQNEKEKNRRRLMKRVYKTRGVKPD